MEVNDSISQLNPAQQQAVTYKFGNLLVLAGAGSGKTRVLISRIYWLLSSQGVAASSVLAVTFTNKAAAELRSRLSVMLGAGMRSIWVGTFHGIAHRMLRKHWQQANLAQNFQVLDSDDQLRIIKRIFKSLEIDEDRFEPKAAQNYINRKKDDALLAHQVQTNHYHDRVMAEVYQHYENHCQNSGVVDFADLLLKSYHLLLANPDLAEYYQSSLSHFLVDEFQDTNKIQYLWLKLLAKRATSITVVGDDDQSIYGWRGALIENIRLFTEDYPDTEVIRLEQNYRSTSTILQAANALISNNQDRLGKNLWTDGAKGELITLYCGLNEEDEALYIARTIQSYYEQGGRLSDVGILYRSNAQSRVVEEALLRVGVAYRIQGGVRFFERAEIKDALAYIKLALNPKDDEAFERVVNSPPRGVGKTSIQKLRIAASADNLTLFEVAKQAVEHKLVSPKARTGLQSFIALIADLQSMLGDSVTEIVAAVIERSGLLTYFRTQTGESAQSKADNLQELVSATADFRYELDDLQDEATPIIDFLAYAALEAGELQVGNDADAVMLMTLHAAKGLEFPQVFICGLEESLFPNHYAVNEPARLAEERRLFYVGITRAMQKLYLSYASRRRVFGHEEMRRTSRFVREIPEQLLEEKGRRLRVSQPTAQLDDSQGSYAIGKRVLHPKFGVGTVIDSEGQGERARLRINFDDAGTKWLVLSYARLEEID